MSIDDERVRELKEQLALIIEELDEYSVNPSTLDFKNKKIDATLYYHPINVELYTKASGREIHVDDDKCINRYYYNAIQELGALLRNSVSRFTDYVVINKDPEGTISDGTLYMYVWEKVQSSFRWYSDYKDSFSKDDYIVEVYECYVDRYSNILESIKKASDLRTKKKKNPLPPVCVIWEDQMYDYLLEQNAFDKEIMKFRLEAGQDFSTELFGFYHMKPFIKSGKKAEFSVVLKKGTQNEIENAFDELNFVKNELDTFAVIERGPEEEGNEVRMLVRGKNEADKKAELEEKEKQIHTFVTEDNSVKLDRAVKMFAAYVNMVERSMDLTNEYNSPRISYASFKGECVVGPDKYDRVTEFLDAIKVWMENHDMHYDYDDTPKEIIGWIRYYFKRIVSNDNYMPDLDGFIGVRAPIGIAVALLNYATPFSDIVLEFARDKYDSEGGICLTMERYDEIGEISE